MRTILRWHVKNRFSVISYFFSCQIVLRRKSTYLLLLHSCSHQALRGFCQTLSSRVCFSPPITSTYGVFKALLYYLLMTYGLDMLSIFCSTADSSCAIRWFVLCMVSLQSVLFCRSFQMLHAWYFDETENIHVHFIKRNYIPYQPEYSMRGSVYCPGFFSSKIECYTRWGPQ